MKRLPDENLSAKILNALPFASAESKHVGHLGFSTASDFDIWKFAGSNGFAILTKDSDFSQLSLLHGAPPKVIWLRAGNASTNSLCDLLMRKRPVIELFAKLEEMALLMLDNDDSSQ